ncbi:TetR/AcrR family transcriptional regulator [Streptomyces litchfieldiae]|uniref:TetR family transcriptional regulator n=1 Tax=Streptomyces litchfieldiae TaxID=3075543 RepID=A0ABU2MIZ6_9ACTN|nr:TetR family transcriptional regulator [Streptomyces sp. DSM 44938]MDT0341571.1 TetR family transcriptional regulator [Streptomyces sp. DSM 44938]
MSESPRLSRAERRRRTEERILDAARELFAEHGFERTTIRAVAAAAGVDPALVMQYYGSKQKLFAQAAAVRLPQPPAEGPRHPDELIDALLTALGVKLDGLPATSLATMRSMLTHPEAAELARETLTRQIDDMTGALSGPDARARAALLICTTVGVTIGHQLLSLEPLRDAPPERLADLLRPALRGLITPPESPAP